VACTFWFWFLLLLGGGSESASSPAVMPMSTSTALRGAKKLRARFSYGRATTALSGLLDRPCFLAEPGPASFEEIVLFRLRCSRNSPSSRGMLERKMQPSANRLTETGQSSLHPPSGTELHRTPHQITTSTKHSVSCSVHSVCKPTSAVA
jgi:hypothetical protein